MPPDQESSALSPFYSWYILGASFLILFFNAGARLSIGVIFKPLISEFGWTRSQVSLAFLVNMTVFALSLVVVGRIYDRYGPYHYHPLWKALRIHTCGRFDGVYLVHTSFRGWLLGLCGRLEF